MRGTAIFLLLLGFASFFLVEGKLGRHHHEHHALVADEGLAEKETSEWKIGGGDKCCRCIVNPPGMNQMYGRFWLTEYCTVDLSLIHI